MKLKEIFQKIGNKYVNFMTKLDPPTWWKTLRFIIHWTLLPIKVSLMFILFILLHIYMLIFWRTRKIQTVFSKKEDRKDIFKNMISRSPVFDNTHLQFYALRIPFHEIPTGHNHNTDHMLARNGVYSFILSKLGRKNIKVSRALGMHINPPILSRGFYLNSQNLPISNHKNTSGDQLIGLTLSMLHEEDDVVLEQYERLVIDIIKHDYSLIETNSLGVVTKKASRGDWAPGINPVGAQALTILCALKMAVKLGSPDAKKAYKKLIWQYGYAILSFIPTLFLPSIKRGYYNDNNCLMAAYILAKLSNNKFSKFYWSLIALFVWSLSYKWYNPYFTGIINELFPNLISKKYTQKCKDYLFENKPIFWSKYGSVEKKVATFPVPFNNMQLGEFWPDEQQKIVRGNKKYLATLGWLASYTMIDPKEAKEFMDEID